MRMICHRTRLLLFVVVVLAITKIASVVASVKTNSTTGSRESSATSSTSNSTITAATSWYEYFMEQYVWDKYRFRPPPPKVIEQKLQEDVRTTTKAMHRPNGVVQEAQEHVRQHLKQIDHDRISLLRRVDREIRRGRHRLYRGVRRYVFRQRVGWDLLVHCILNHVGLVLGSCLVWNGYNACWVHEVAVAVQVGLVAWNILTLASSDTQHTDLMAAAAGMAVWKVPPPPTISKLFNPFFLSLFLFYTTGTILANDKNEQRTPRWMTTPTAAEPPSLPAGKALLATILSILGITRAKIPIPMVASALAGATLVYKSVAVEISGNWVEMIRHIYWIVSRVLRPVMCLAAKVVRRVGIRGFVRWAVRELLSWNVTGQARGVIQKALDQMRVLLRSYRAYQSKVRSYVANLPVVREFLKITSTLQTVATKHRREILPMALAGSGVARQMGWAVRLGDMRRVFLSIRNPGKTLLRAAKQYGKSILQAIKQHGWCNNSFAARSLQRLLHFTKGGFRKTQEK